MRDAQVLSLFPKRANRSSFTLVEMLVAFAVLIIILGIVFELTAQISQVWRSSTSRIQTFQEARAGFEAMTRRLGQANLNVYYDYYATNASGNYYLRTSANSSTFVPYTYNRASELHFISGQATNLLTGSPTAITTQTHAVFFQAPLGYSATYKKLANAVNACGYYLQFDAGASSIPAYVTNAPSYKARYRYRLMEMLQPTENLGVYYGLPTDWFVQNAYSNSRILAENVIALVLLPKLAPAMDTSGTNMAPYYNYDSRITLGAATDTNVTPTPSSPWPVFPGDSFTTLTNGASATITMTRHNQLPPIMHVVMVVIDEPSAIRLQGSSTSVPSGINFAALSSPLFVNSANLSNDIQSVEDVCNAKSGNVTGNTIRLNYQIFESDIMMRDAQWSNN